MTLSSILKTKMGDVRESINIMDRTLVCTLYAFCLKSMHLTLSPPFCVVTIIPWIPLIRPWAERAGNNMMRYVSFILLLEWFTTSQRLWVYRISVPYAQKDPRFLFEKRMGQPREFWSLVSTIDGSTLPQDCGRSAMRNTKKLVKDTKKTKKHLKEITFGVPTAQGKQGK